MYVLKCLDGTLYTGITTDINRRLKEHKNGIGSRYTRSRGAGKIIYAERHKNRSTASIREAEIKRMKRADKLLLAKR